jgi:glucuronyl/N-acetylglucosaminyl transferase EXT1
MMCRWRSLLLVFTDAFILAIFLFFLNFWIYSRHHLGHRKISYMDHHQYLVSSSWNSIRRTGTASSAQQCTMGTCFDFSRCRGPQGFKVYVYPSDPDAKVSPLFRQILSVIESSPYITSDPEEACLLVPSLDTLDRDRHSREFVSDLQPLDSLPHWNGGRNHLLFIQFSGTWPEYTQRLDFSTGQALLARASFNTNVFRSGFDISIPLMHKKHPGSSEKHSGVLSRGTSPGFLPVKRKYLLVFKGKRYLYGEGSRIRSSLHHLHNKKDIVMLTTCKHNQDWVKYTDNRCDLDNTLYDRSADALDGSHQIVLCVLQYPSAVRRDQTLVRYLVCSQALHSICRA